MLGEHPYINEPRAVLICFCNQLFLQSTVRANSHVTYNINCQLKLFACIDQSFCNNATTFIRITSHCNKGINWSQINNLIQFITYWCQYQQTLVAALQPFAAIRWSQSLPTLQRWLADIYDSVMAYIKCHFHVYRIGEWWRQVLLLSKQLLEGPLVAPLVDQMYLAVSGLLWLHVDQILFCKDQGLLLKVYGEGCRRHVHLPL